jgi:hypothetical protein
MNGKASRQEGSLRSSKLERRWIKEPLLTFQEYIGYYTVFTLIGKLRGLQ